jgi:hypothetical protein
MVSQPDNSRSVTSSVCERGQRIYDENLKSILEPQHLNAYVVIDVETGAYEVDRDLVAATDRAEAKHAGTQLYMARVGWNALCRIGGRTLVRPS